MLFFKKRFLLILHELTNTGAPRAVLNLCKTLISLGVDVWVISLKAGPLLDEFKNTGVKTFCLNYKKIKKFSFLFYFFDVVICNTICCYKLVDWFLRMHINVYWWLHEASYFSEKIIQDNKKCIRALKKCKHIFCVSKYAKEFFEKYNKNIKILGITIDDEFDSYKKNKANEKISLLYCGELHPRIASFQIEEMKHMKSPSFIRIKRETVEIKVENQEILNQIQTRYIVDPTLDIDDYQNVKVMSPKELEELQREGKVRFSPRLLWQMSGDELKEIKRFSNNLKDVITMNPNRRK